MNIIQCTFCRKPFQSIGRRICNGCLEQIDRDFVTVRDYIYEHKQTDIDTVAEETGVAKQTILYLLKDGRLILDDPGGAGGMLRCEACKKPITSGRMCEDCKDMVAKTMKKSIETHKSAGSRNGEDRNKGSVKLERK